MIIALVQIPLEDPKRETDAVIRPSLDSTRIFREVVGLRSKYYLNSEAGGGGIYEFDSRRNALACFNDGWADWIERRFGVRPTLTLFENPVVLKRPALNLRHEHPATL